MNQLSLAEELNRHCQWITSSGRSLAHPVIDEDGLTAPYPVFIQQQSAQRIIQVIQILSGLTKNNLYQRVALKELPDTTAVPTAVRGVFMGFDFHISPSGPKLIEVNTNAGGVSIVDSLNLSQRPCCEDARWLMKSPVANEKELYDVIIDMFKKEYAQQQPDKKLMTLAIMDSNPQKQFLWQEFQWFKKLFQQAGWEVFILDPSELDYDGQGLTFQGKEVDLIYNRHTDFYLQSDELALIKQAYLKSQVVLTPNPRNYGLLADKRQLSLLSQPSFLESLNLDQTSTELLLKVIPKTHVLTSENAEHFWRHRKKYFFKPKTGFGSRASYSGAKLTRKKWHQLISSQHYIAQEFIEPGQRNIMINGENRDYKSDVRYYVYDGQILLVAARLYRGQATNMKTPGGGFATVYQVAT